MSTPKNPNTPNKQDPRIFDMNPNQTLVQNDLFEDSTEITQLLQIQDDQIVEEKALEPSNMHITIHIFSKQDERPQLLKVIEFYQEDQKVIGRDDMCELQLNYPTVSKKHAIINCNKNKQLFIIDIGSTNGTIVNQRRISSATQIREGDDIIIGDALLQVKILTTVELTNIYDLLSKIEKGQLDVLTGLYRRDYLTTELPKLMKTTLENNRPISCAFVDLDKFKAINDTFGHHIGDKVLQIISGIIVQNLRKNDPCIRYGGDEMLIILPRASAELSFEVIQRIRLAILNYPWHDIQVGLEVSASFGIAEYTNGEGMVEWISHADEATYESKRLGRNRVTIYPPVSK